jgi:hypothetical protein
MVLLLMQSMQQAVLLLRHSMQWVVWRELQLVQHRRCRVLSAMLQPVQRMLLSVQLTRHVV